MLRQPSNSMVRAARANTTTRAGLWRAASAVAAAGLLLAVSGCGLFGLTPNRNVQPEGPAELLKFADDAEMLGYMQDQLDDTLNAQSGGFFGALGRGGDDVAVAGGGPVPNSAPAADGDFGGSGGEAAPLAGGDASNATPGFSTTNIQEVGVDEADFVKNTAGEAFAISGNEVVALLTQPNDKLEVLSRMSVPGVPEGIYLAGSRLAVVYAEGGYFTCGVDWGVTGGIEPLPAIAVDGDFFASPAPQRPTVGAVIFDVSDLENPQQVMRYEFDGTLMTSRRIDGTLHLVSVNYPSLPNPLTVPETTLETFVPMARVSVGSDASTITEQLAARASDSYRPRTPNGYTTTAILSLDIMGGEPSFTSTMVAANTGLVYASTEAIYLTDTQYRGDGFGRETTSIHKFTLTDTGSTYAASGRVDGRPINQFSLSEHEGVLRIATHAFDWMGFDIPVEMPDGSIRQPGNLQAGTSVFTLVQDGNKLVTRGSVRGIEPDEMLFAARFQGNRGYLVTFEQIDPFFTLDLSDVNNPRVIGELKIPGFSRYLHPIGENHVMGLGRDVDASDGFPREGGVQLSLFDVSDFANPQRVANVVFGSSGSDTSAEWDHRALTFFEQPDGSMRLAMPLRTTGLYYEPTFAGLQVVDIEPATNTITPVGRMMSSPGTDSDPLGFNLYERYVRGVFTGDNVLCITPYYITAAPVDAMDQVSRLEIAPPPSNQWGGWGGDFAEPVDGDEPVLFEP